MYFRVIAVRHPGSLLLAGLLASCPVFAHLPEQFGRDYLRVEPENHQPQQDPQPTVPMRTPGAAEIHTEAEVRAGEVATGAYGAGLADPLVNLSTLQLERGDLDDAAISLRRAIQLVRINDGLYSQSQVPLLQRLIAVYRELGDYDALGDTYGRYFRVITATGTALTPEQLPRVMEYLDWERQLYASRDDGEQRVHLLRAYEANRDLLERADDVPPSVYVDLATSQLRNLYLILGDRPLSSMPADLPSEEKQLALIQRSADARGRRLLEESLARLEGAPPRQRARIHLELGDWRLWNEHLHSAHREYVRVIELMEQADAQEELASWFDEPVELPNKRGLWSPLQEENGEVPVVVEASYEVNTKGEARRVEVSAADEAGEWQAGRIRRMLREAHYRPRVSADGFEYGPRVTRHYRLVGNN